MAFSRACGTETENCCLAANSESLRERADAPNSEGIREQARSVLVAHRAVLLRRSVALA
jgi:hypothetical protein